MGGQGNKSPPKGASAAHPDGGWGWMIVAGCFLTNICTRAVTRCVSIFFVEFQLHFGRDNSGTAWIHSLVDCTTMLCAPLGSFIGTRLSCRATVVLGGLLSSAGLVLSSFATSLEHLYLSLGVLTGLGFALSYTPAVAMVGSYFSERRALAYGIAMSGSGIGTFVLAPAVQLLIEYYSWRGALLILGGFVSNLCVCGALMRPLESPGGPWGGRGAGELEKGSAAKASTGEGKFPAKGKLTEHKMDARLEHKMDAKLEHTDVKLGIENGKLAQMNLAKAMLVANGKLVKPRRCKADPKALESLSAVSAAGSLAGKMLAEMKLADPNVGVGGKLEDMKLVESLVMGAKVTDAMLAEEEDKMADGTACADGKAKLADAKLADAKLAEAKLADAKLADAKLADAKLADAKLATLSAPRAGSSVRDGVLCVSAHSEDLGFLWMPDFQLLSLSFLFLACGCSVPIVYLVPYARSVGVAQGEAAALMALLGVSGIVGNVTFGWLTDRKCLRPYRVLSYMAAVGMEGLCCLFFPLLRSFPLLVPVSMLYGYFDGAYVALIPVVTSDVVGVAYLTSALGVVYFLHAIPYLVSPPIGGWLVDVTGSYTAAFFLSGFSLMCSPLVLGTVMWIRRCWRTQLYSVSDMDP